MHPIKRAMVTENSNFPTAARDAAAYWFARVHSGSFTVGERERLQQWRQAHPDNDREYRALAEIWQATTMLSEADLREMLEAPEPSSHVGRHTRRRWFAAAGAVCAAAVVGGVLMNGHMLESPVHTIRYTTAAGEQRSEAQPDGSIIQMNVSTELVVRYYAARRIIELMRGEATFDVTANPHRPFLVDAGAVSVRVTGTVFNVRRDEDSVAVAVQSGTVEVASGHWWNRDKAMLDAGMTAQTRPGDGLLVKPGDVSALTAWRQGKVVFEDQPLEDMVREMNRYLSHPIRLADSKLKRLRMAGVFNIQDADGFLQALQSNLPIAVRRRQDGGADLSLLR